LCHIRKPAARATKSFLGPEEMAMGFCKDWGDWSKAWREKNGLNQEETAQLCGITDSTLSKIENANYRTQALQLVLRTLDVMGAELRIADKVPLLPVPTSDPANPNLMARILEIPTPPADGRTYARLFGAVVALLKYWELINDPRRPTSLPRWEFEKLLPGLNGSIEKYGWVDYMYSRDFSRWAMGFCRNHVYRHTSVVLMRCVRELLTRKLPQDASWLQKELHEQLELLKICVASDNASELNLIADLADVFSQYAEDADKLKHTRAEVASRRIQELTFTLTRRFPRGIPLEEVVDDDRLVPSGIECICIVFLLDSSFLSQEETFGLDFIVEWVIAAKALLFTGIFWKQIIKEYQREN
jgi:transcriptional regulator with XRE-family HTH domain